MRPDLTPISRFPDLEKPERDRLNQLLRLLILTTRGDILTRGATYLKRLAIGTAGKVLHSDGTDVDWATLQANEVAVEILSGADYDDVQDYINFFGNRTLLSGGTITSEGDGDAAMASCTAWCKESDSDTAVGKFFNFDGVGNISLDDLVTNFIYLDYNKTNGSATPQVVVATSVLTHGFKQDHIFIAAVYRSGNTLHIHQSDNLGIAGVNRAHLHHLEEFYVHRASGMVTSSVGVRQLAVATGVLYAGLNRNTTNAFNTSTGGTFSYWYYDGDADPDAIWVEVATQNAIDSANYNDVDTGLVAHSAAAKRGVHWVYMDNDGVHLHVVYGQEDYSTAQAELATVPGSLPPIVTGYCTLIAKIIVQKDQDTLYISYPWTEAFKTSLATDHGSLAGLGDDDHAQYVKDNEFTTDERILVASGAGTFAEKTPAQYLAILSGEAAANFAMNSNKITGVTDPTANQDAATKKYVDDNVVGISDIVEDTTPQLGGDLDLNTHSIDFPTTANVSDCLDEDNMASDSATMLATQQSIKAYADTRNKIVWLSTAVIVMSDLNRTATLTYTDLDITANTSADAKYAIFRLHIGIDSISAGGACLLSVRKNGDTPVHMPRVRVADTHGDTAGAQGQFFVMVGLDAGQVLEYEISIAGTIRVDSYIILLGYIE